MIRRSVLTLVGLVFLMGILAACGGAPTAPTPTVPPPVVVSCGSAEFRDLKADLGVAAVVVKPDGDAPLYSSTCVDQQQIVARIPSGTNLVPTEARALFSTNANGAALEAGMFYKVRFNDSEGWLFSEQLNYELTAPKAPIVKPTLSPNGAGTATAISAAHVPAGSSVPYYTSIGTPAVEALGGAKYVYLYDSPSFDGVVVALVPPRKGASVILVRDNPGGQLVVKAQAAYHEGTWFEVLINHSQGWAHESSLFIN